MWWFRNRVPRGIMLINFHELPLHVSYISLIVPIPKKDTKHILADQLYLESTMLAKKLSSTLIINGQYLVPACWAWLSFCPVRIRSKWFLMPSLNQRSALFTPTPKTPVKAWIGKKENIKTIQHVVLSTQRLILSCGTFMAWNCSDCLVVSTSLDVPSSRIS